ncbi:hypothetical protein BpHYR1_050357 [Brachionus plicatilis]|uniref:Uncharacterized protein n=1 Tax=Brachionus plicatilis TaxID=10195 RepID=A0A3M7P4Z5_BRAPC|nr:hypothetical protein BpHYR1_050357 [Brachionus plicatilis]
MDTSICIIESDSDNSIIFVESVCIERQKNNDSEANLKRDLSLDIIANTDLESKKIKTIREKGENNSGTQMSSNKATSSDDYKEKAHVLNARQIDQKQKSISLNHFFASDFRLDRRLYYNRIDENNDFDINLLIWSELEFILDKVCSKSIVYSVEHYYHQLLKRKRAKQSYLTFKKISQEYEQVFSEVDSKLLPKDDYLSAKRNYENQIKNQEIVFKLLHQDLKNFANFILEVYGNKIIIP